MSDQWVPPPERPAPADPAQAYEPLDHQTPPTYEPPPVTPLTYEPPPVTPPTYEPPLQPPPLFPPPPPWGIPATARPTAGHPPPTRGWNWAGGTVIGVLAISAVYAVPALLLRLDLGSWDEITTGEGLLWGSLIVGILAVALLATDNPLAPGVAAFVAACLGVAAILVDVTPWDLPRQAAYNPWIAVLAYAVLGLCALIGLRRRD